MQVAKFIRKQWEWFALGALLLLFLAIKLPTIGAYFADGWIYFYFGKLIHAGDLPYRDFYYSSPPLLPYLAGLFHFLFGFNLAFADSLPTLFSLVDALLIFLLLRKKTSPASALLAAAVYLLSFATLATTKFYSEAHPLTTFALAGLLFFINGRNFWSGIFFGLAGLTKLYGLIPATFLPFLLLRKPRELFYFLGAILISFGIPNLIFLALIGREYLDFIFFNHLHKTAGIPKLRIAKFFFTHDWGLCILPGLFFFLKPKKRVWLPLLPIAALLIFYLLFADIYYLYAKVFVACLAVLLAFIFSQKFRFAEKPLKNTLLTLLLLSSLAAIYLYRDYAPVGRIDDPSTIAKAVAVQTPEDGAIYGDFSITPLTALLSDREIFRNYVDTNSKFIGLGVIDTKERAQELLEEKVPTVISKSFVNPQTLEILGLGTLLPENFFREHCQPKSAFPIAADYESNQVILWKCGENP